MRQDEVYTFEMVKEIIYKNIHDMEEEIKELKATIAKLEKEKRYE